MILIKGRLLCLLCLCLRKGTQAKIVMRLFLTVKQDTPESKKWSGDHLQGVPLFVQGRQGNVVCPCRKSSLGGMFVWWLFSPLERVRLYGVDHGWQHNSRAGIKKILIRIYSIILKSLPMTRDSRDSESLERGSPV